MYTVCSSLHCMSQQRASSLITVGPQRTTVKNRSENGEKQWNMGRKITTIGVIWEYFSRFYHRFHSVCTVVGGGEERLCSNGANHPTPLFPTVPTRYSHTVYIQPSGLISLVCICIVCMFFTLDTTAGSWCVYNKKAL
jgi:hypothetical protein